MLRKTLDQFPLARPYLLVTAIAIALFWPTWFRLVGEWLKWEQVLAHGLPTFAIFIGLLLIHPPPPLENRARRSFSVLGSLSLLATVVAWALLELVRIDTLTYLMLPAGLLALAWALLGAKAMLRFLPYVLLFGLSLPVWSDLVPHLVVLATAVVTKLVAGMGITALIEGANITLPYGRLVIADGCSGIRYFAISLLLAMMMAILNDFRWKGWLVALSVGASVALVVNWVRITALVVIAYQSDMESSLVADHETFGWAIYAAFVIPIMWLAPVLRREGTPDGAPPHLLKMGFVAVVAAFLVGPLGVSLAHSRASGSPAWALAVPGFVKTDPEALPLKITLPETLSQEVWSAGQTTWISLAQTRNTERGDKLVPYLPPRVSGNWFRTDQDAGYGSNVRVYQHLTERRQVVTAERFQVGAYTTTSYTKAKLLQIPATLSGENRFALISVQGICAPRSCDSAVQRVRTALDNLTLDAAR
ncbi:exosortase [Marinobacter segnicrescens]|uniref:Exosortase n=1 Tax=Marinobacter segnicrescens TaxID=430453 RepID=A0A1I0H1C7_9GAMM|nr:exosortase/archaeosortase family protein [Marinobacter segnicrescens]SET77496.1 exosortase [Marinobacter segnicrescens]